MRPVLGAPAFDTLRAKKMDALYVAINELLNANRLRIVTSAQAAKLPTILGTRYWADRDHTSRDARREGRHRITIRFGGRYWHQTDIPTDQPNAWLRGNSGHENLRRPLPLRLKGRHHAGRFLTTHCRLPFFCPLVAIKKAQSLSEMERRVVLGELRCAHDGRLQFTMKTKTKNP
jgi:hypothetical protein